VSARSDEVELAAGIRAGFAGEPDDDRRSPWWRESHRLGRQHRARVERERREDWQILAHRGGLYPPDTPLELRRQP